jgi:hypothetical protein
MGEDAGAAQGFLIVYFLRDYAVALPAPIVAPLHTLGFTLRVREGALGILFAYAAPLALEEGYSIATVQLRVTK